MNSQNGWPVLPANSPLLHTWVIPARNGMFTLRTRNGSAGFVLALFALWYAEEVERVKGPVPDDWGWSPLRDVRGGSTISNHCSGTAIDLNATAHGLGALHTFTPAEERIIHTKLRQFHGVIRWGEDYIHRTDGMHYELVQPLGVVESQARACMRWPRGVRVLQQNPGQRRVINS